MTPEKLTKFTQIVAMIGFIKEQQDLMGKATNTVDEEIKLLDVVGRTLSFLSEGSKTFPEIIGAPTSKVASTMFTVGLQELDRMLSEEGF